MLNDFRNAAYPGGHTGQAQTQGLDPHEIDLFAQDPARIILAKTRGPDQGLRFIVRRILAKVGAG